MQTVNNDDNLFNDKLMNRPLAECKTKKWKRSYKLSIKQEIKSIIIENMNVMMLFCANHLDILI